ncbi:TPA: hypothetical protein ACH3X1_000915 [Trebouxia sp. C0004]
MVQHELETHACTASCLVTSLHKVTMQPPRAFQHSLQANAGLVKRLSHTHTFKGHSSTVNALDWSPDGEVLLSGSDDCRVKLWSAESGKAVQSFDSGHTSSIYVTKFMPNTGNEQIITSAADRQVRLVNLHRSAVKPYTFHHGRVKALVPLDPFMFISGSDDGTVRHYDTREPASTSSIPGMRTGDVLADQRYERTPRGRAKVSINAVAVDPMRPYLFVTGSSDPLMRLYDRRMSLQRGHTQSPSGRSWPQWVSCFIPSGLKTDTMQPRTGTERAPFVTSVKFSGGGDQVIASYSGDNIYSFDCVDHARESEGYCTAQGWSRPNSAFGTRSASRHAILHASATGTAVSDGHAARQASQQSPPPETQQQQATTATQTDEVAHASSDAGTASVPVPAVMGSRATAGRPSNSGRITSAAAAAVAQIRRRRAAAARTQDSAYLHASSSAAAGIEADAVPGAAASSEPHVGSDGNHGHCRQVAASTAAVDSSSIRTGEPHVEGGVPCEQANLPATSSGLSVPVTVDGTRPGPSVEREGVPRKGTGQLADRLPSAPRPPLPFHPIRRSARLHKSAGNTPGTGPLADGDGLEVGNIPASSAQNDVKAEAAGPYTRHDCKRKLAELSESAGPVSEQPLAPPSGADQHIVSSSRPGIHSLARAPAAAARQQPHCHLAGSPAADVAAAATAEVSVTHRHSSAAARLQPVSQQPNMQNARDTAERSQPAAARSLRHCRSLHSFADKDDGRRTEQNQADSGRNPTVQQLAQRAQHEADSLNAQHVEACVASSRRLEQPTASTGTSRPVPLAHRGTSMHASQAGETVPLGPPDFLRLQYSTDPPSSAYNSRESTPDQAAEVTQPNQAAVQMQAGAAGISTEFPRPSRHTRRARASRLAPLPATSTAHDPNKASATLPLDPPDIVSRHTDDAAAHSGACSGHDNGPAISASTEARACSCNGLEDPQADPGTDAEPMVQQPREGTPVSSNCCHYRARGRASVEASNAPRAPLWRPGSSTLATAELSSGNSPRGSHNHSIQPACAEHQVQEPEIAGTAEEEVLSPHQSRHSHVERTSQPGAVDQTPADGCHEGTTGPSSSYMQLEAATLSKRRANTAVQHATQQADRHEPSALPDTTSPSKSAADRVTAATAAAGVHGTPEDMSWAASVPRQEPVVPHGRRRQRSSMLRRSTSQAIQPPRLASRPPTAAAAVDTRQEAVRAAPDGPSSSPAGDSTRAAAHSPLRAARGSPGVDSASGPSHSADGHLADYSREGQMQPHGSHDAHLTGVVDSFVGAILQESSDDDGDGEVVEERGMFQQCYKGHCNLSLNKGVCLLGSRDEYVASGSDDGRIFVWDRFNGLLVNMLSSDDQNVSCVAAHPSMPVLASAGSEPVIKLWSPQAESACNLERAEAIMLHNAQELAEGDRRSNLAGPPPMWLNMLGTAVSAELRAPGEVVPARNANPVRCTIM